MATATHKCPDCGDTGWRKYPTPITGIGHTHGPCHRCEIRAVYQEFSDKHGMDVDDVAKAFSRKP